MNWAVAALERVHTACGGALYGGVVAPLLVCGHGVRTGKDVLRIGHDKEGPSGLRDEL